MGGSGTYTGSSSQNMWMIAQMKAHGYKNGSKHIPYNQLAWTQENGNEMIYRASDGAMLTPVGRGDMVFTKEMSNYLWNMARTNTTPNFVSNMPKLENITPQNKGIRDISLVIDGIQMYGVNDPVQFTNNLKQSLQNDRVIEKIVQSIAFDASLGRNSLSKKKY